MAKSLVQRFLDARNIGHGGNRARVSYGIAAEMTQVEKDEAKQIMLQEAEERLSKLIELEAPEVLLKAARGTVEKIKDGTHPAIKILNKQLS